MSHFCGRRTLVPLLCWWFASQLAFAFKHDVIDIAEILQNIYHDQNPNQTVTLDAAGFLQSLDNNTLGWAKKHCSSSVEACGHTWKVYGQPVALPCAVASGKRPSEYPMTLPMYYVGNYDLCGTFPEAHYCVVETGPIALPFVNPDGSFQRRGFILGPLILGQCVSTKCNAELLRIQFLSEVQALVNKVVWYARWHMRAKVPQVKQLGKFLESYLINTTTVNCADKEISLDFVGYTWIVVMLLLVGLVLMASVYDMCVMHINDRLDPFAKPIRREFQNDRERLLCLFSAYHNTARLSSAIAGDFNVLNGIRVVSLLWIIFGHTVLTGEDPNVVNPTEIQRTVESLEFTLIKGAEYAVDTFYFLSGFLATWGVIRQLDYSDGSMSVRQYFAMMAIRWLRLVPSYAVVLVFWWKVLPWVGSGPFWYKALQDDGGIGSPHSCDGSWWANLLFINNLYPYSPQALADNRGICMSWSWYLANDFQFFALVPPIVLLYLKGEAIALVNNDKRVFKYLCMFGPCVTLVLIQFISTAVAINHFHLLGTLVDPNFRSYLYFRPWCRMSPYVVGINLAFLHRRRTQAALAAGNPRGWMDSYQQHSRLYVSAGFGLALSVMAVIVFGLFSQYQCLAEDPVECQAWYALLFYGYLVSGNWSSFTVTCYYTFTYIAWAVSVAYICYTFFCGFGSTVLRILSHKIFNSLARLTYNAYLVHMVLMITVHYSFPTLTFFSPVRYVLEFLSFSVLAYTVSYFLYLLVEKPAMNLVSEYLQLKKTTVHSNDNGNMHRADLTRTLSHFSDVDSETIAMASPLKLDDEINSYNGDENDSQFLDYQRMSTSND